MTKANFLLLFVISTIVLCTQPKRVLSIKEQINLQSPAALTVSPDGKYIAYTIRTADLQKSTWNTQVYVIETATGKARQFTTHGKSCTKPGFTPDAKFLSFLSSRDFQPTGKSALESGSIQLWLAPLDGGEALNVTDIPNGVSEYTFHRNGMLAVLTEVSDPDEDALEARKKHKNDEVVYPVLNPVKELRLYNFLTRELVHTYPLDRGAAGIVFSANGESVLYHSNLTGDYNDEQKFDLYAIDNLGKIKQLTHAEGPEEDVKPSPDGKYVIYKIQTVPDIEFAEADLAICPIDDFSKPRNLTAAFGLTVTAYQWKDTENILFLANNQTVNSLYQLHTGTGKITLLSSAGESISEFCLTTTGNICTRVETSTTLPELLYNGKQMSNFSAQLQGYATGTQELVSYPAYDGKFSIEGILFKPEGYDKSKRYPVIFTLHGGPYGHFKNVFTQSYPVRQLLSAGYVVFAPNPRGSSGYSDAFSQANRYDLGGGDYRDIMDGIHYLYNNGIIDTAKMGVMGGSYGGYLTNWVISQTNSFKAAVSLFGIFSFFTDWSNSWQPVFEKMYFGYYYWERPIDKDNLYVSRSPAFYADKIITPTLILQGEKDVYTDIANSREMYQVLRTRNIPVSFVVYPREGHGIRNEPNHYINTVERTLEWFQKYVKP